MTTIAKVNVSTPGEREILMTRQFDAPLDLALIESEQGTKVQS